MEFWRLGLQIYWWALYLFYTAFSFWILKPITRERFFVIKHAVQQLGRWEDLLQRIISYLSKMKKGFLTLSFFWEMQTWCMIIEQNIFIIIYTKDGKQKAFFPIPIYIYIYFSCGSFKASSGQTKVRCGILDKKYTCPSLDESRSI